MNLFNREYKKPDLDFKNLGVEVKSYCSFTYGMETAFDIGTGSNWCPMIIFDVYREKTYRLYTRNAYMAKGNNKLGDFFWRVKDNDDFRLSLLEFGHNPTRLYEINLAINRFTKELNYKLRLHCG